MNNNDLLNKLLNHAYETVPYYKKSFDDHNVKSEQNYNLNNIPILTKDMVVQSEDLFISDKYKNKYLSGGLILKRTSGSTGKCMNVYWLQNDFYISNIEAWKYRSLWYDISIKDKYINFHSTLYNNNNLINNPEMIIKRNTSISFSKTTINKENIQLYLKEINEFKPVWMLVQPSVLYAILFNIDSNEMNVLNNIKYIELISEYLHKSTREYFEECLPKVKFSNMYGTTETGVISLECPYGNQHILNNTVVEVVDDNFKNPITNFTEGNIILTSLRNTAMPFIRYCIGDRGRIIESQCECGYEGHDTYITLGREGDIIELPNGVKKHSSVLLNTIEEICDEYPNSIIQFHFVQENINLFKICLSINDKYKNWIKSIEESFINTMKRHVYNDINCTFEYNSNEFLNSKNKLKTFTKKF